MAHNLLKKDKRTPALTARAVGQQKREMMQTHIDGLVGQDGAKILNRLVAIAMGEATYTDKQGNVCTPDMPAQISAASLILAYQFGKPKQIAEIDVQTSTAPAAIDPSKLSDDELKKLEELFNQATVDVTPK